MRDIAASTLRDVETPCAICGLFHLMGAACPVASPLSLRRAGHDAAPGTVFGGRFEVIDVVHRSGMSTIYRARNMTDRGETVAVKQVSVHSLSPEEQAEARRWLAREAGLLSSLNDPLLPDLIAAFSEGDEHYVVMPYLEGRTLKEVVGESGPLELPDMLSFTRALTNLLIHLHGHSPPIIHRDLKPDNILIMPDRTLKVLDLGIARPLDRDVPGTAIGTPGYAAPEQYQGLADERSDIYSLGAVMHYMLTGYDAEEESPFRHPPVRQLNPALGPVTEAFVLKLLRLAPGERPNSATALLDCLDRFEYAQLQATITANYVYHLQGLTRRMLPISLTCIGLAAIAQRNLLGFPAWLSGTLSSGESTLVAAVSFASVAIALHIPNYTAKTIRTKASFRLMLPLPSLAVVICLVVLYTYTVPRTIQWILLPAELVLPYVATVIGWRRAETRSKQAHERILDIIPAETILLQD